MEKVLLFVIRILLCVMMAADPSICLIASKILWCTADGLIARGFFWANIEGALCGEIVVVDRCGGCIFDATVTRCVFFITILYFAFVIVVDTLIFSLC